MKLSDTLAHLAAARSGKTPPAAGARADRLRPLPDFGSNPGNLAAHVHLPERWADPRALVVVLHGCTQTAAAYDHGAGWSRLADAQGFALLFPEQKRANNPNLCFNWFQPEDTARDSGEALSIRQMVAAMVAAHGIDPAHVFVTGLSAGGAMTSAMLAAYPDVFAGGAIIAGLPHGSAATMGQALAAMQGKANADPAHLVARIHAASPHQGRWPSVSVWHGTADAVVNPANADAILAQWRGVHGLAEQPSARATVDGHAHRIWRDRAGRVVLEDYRIAGMGHGTPIAATGAEECGAAGPHMLDVGLSSTRRIAAHWGLTGEARASAVPTPDTAPAIADLPALRTIRPVRLSGTAEPARAASGPQKVIEAALRAAGLMR